MFRYIIKRGSCICTPILYRNCDFAPVFFDFVNLPRDFKTKHQFAPTPSFSPNGVKFCIKEQKCPCDFTLVLLCLFVIVPPICD